MIAGHDRNEVTTLLVTNPDHEVTRETPRGLLTSFTAQSTSSPIASRAPIVLEDPSSLDYGEVTDNCSIRLPAGDAQ